MARHQSYAAAHANAQLNANECGQVWVVFNDTSGVWNAEPGRSRATWSGVTFEEVHPQRYKVVVERSGTQVRGKTEVVLWTDDWSAAQRACETAARHVDAVQAFVYDVRPIGVGMTVGETVHHVTKPRAV